MQRVIIETDWVSMSDADLLAEAAAGVALVADPTVTGAPVLEQVGMDWYLRYNPAYFAGAEEEAVTLAILASLREVFEE